MAERTDLLPRAHLADPLLRRLVRVGVRVRVRVRVGVGVGVKVRVS